MSTRYTSNTNFNGGKVEGNQTVYDFTERNLSVPVLVVGLVLVGLVVLVIISI